MVAKSEITMYEDFVTYELAVKLKEKGFDEPCFGWYYPSEVCGFDYKTTVVFNNGEYRGSNYKDMLVSHKDEKYIDAPTISQVLKWLREEKKIAINIEYIPYVWQYKIFDISFEDRFNPYGLTLYSNYEEAALDGIKYVLDNLI